MEKEDEVRAGSLSSRAGDKERVVRRRRWREKKNRAVRRARRKRVPRTAPMMAAMGGEEGAEEEVVVVVGVAVPPGGTVALAIPPFPTGVVKPARPRVGSSVPLLAGTSQKSGVEVGQARLVREGK